MSYKVFNEDEIREIRTHARRRKTTNDPRLKNIFENIIEICNRNIPSGAILGKYSSGDYYAECPTCSTNLVKVTDKELDFYTNLILPRFCGNCGQRIIN